MEPIFPYKPDIAKAAEYLRAFNEDEELRDQALRHEMWLHDQATMLKHAREEGLAEGKNIGLQEGRQEGRQEGLAEGRARARVELAERLRTAGFSPEDIERLSGD